MLRSLTTLAAAVALTLGVASTAAADTLALTCCNRSVVPDVRWRNDEHLGWINNWRYSQRNPSSEMSLLSPDDFQSIRLFFGEA